VSTQTGLLHTRRFLPLFVTQFLGALNDNVLKNALVVLLTFQAANWTSLKPEVLANLAAGIFILPFFLFSATAGQLADKYDKARLAQLVKLLEIGIVLIAGAGFALHSLVLLMSVLFLLGLHSTLFGPVKYAVLPQYLKETELVGGNALIEAGTFIAILLGTLLGGLLAGSADASGTITLAGLVLAVAGYLASRTMPAAPPPAPDLKLNLNPISETWRSIHFARENRTVFLSILGISWFWLYGAMFLAQFPAYTKNVLGGAETAVTLLLATFTLGIGVGSLLCERLSAERVELGLVPFGSIGLTLFGLDLAFASPAGPAGAVPLGAIALLAQPGTWRILGDLALIGAFGGLFIVPLYALVQQRSSASHRARTIAANNIFNAFFMVAGSLAAAALLSSGVSIPALFATAAVCNAAVALYIYGLVPEFLLRFIAWLLIHAVYRLRASGLAHVPHDGPAILVCEQANAIDALMIMAACPRPIRFVIDRQLSHGPLLRFVFGESRAIYYDGAVPLAPTFFCEMEAALAAGDLVGLLNPQALSGVASLLPRIPQLPVTLSPRGGILSRIELAIGAPLPHLAA